MKKKSMVFNFSRKHQFLTDLMLKGKRIEIVDQAKLLGLILTSDLKWEENTNSQTNLFCKDQMQTRAVCCCVE